MSWALAKEDYAGAVAVALEQRHLLRQHDFQVRRRRMLGWESGMGWGCLSREEVAPWRARNIIFIHGLRGVQAVGESGSKWSEMGWDGMAWGGGDSGAGALENI